MLTDIHILFDAVIVCLLVLKLMRIYYISIAQKRFLVVKLLKLSYKKGLIYDISKHICFFPICKSNQTND